MRPVGIAELKAKLSENLARVKKGETITVFNRDTPVARIVPWQGGEEPLRVRPGTGRGKLSDVRIPPMRKKLKVDPVELLLEERARR